MNRRNRFLRGLMWTVVVALLLLVWAAWPGKSTYNVSPETTYVTDKFDEFGHVDYVAALNERLRGTITPETNANVLIWKALGPHPEGGTMPPEYFQWLGVEQPPETGDYFVGFDAHLKQNWKIEASERRQEYYPRQEAAQKAPWDAKSQPELADWLKRNEKPLALVFEATRRPHYYNPLSPGRSEGGSNGLIAALLPNVQKCREFAVALTCRAMFHLAESKVDAAWRDLLTCHRLGRLLVHGGTMIEMLVGIAIDQVASNGDLAFLEHSQLTSAQLLSCLSDLRGLAPMPSVGDKIDLGERFLVLDTMMMAIRHGVKYIHGLAHYEPPKPKNKDASSGLFSFSIDWDPAFLTVNRWYDRCTAAARIPDYKSRRQEMVEIEKGIKDIKRKIDGLRIAKNFIRGATGRGELVGDIIVALMLPAVEKVVGAADRSEQTRRNLHLAFAVAAYRQQNGRYPTRPEVLAPWYLDAVPDDLFSGKPIVYEADFGGVVFYSVGQNEKDDAGRSHDDSPRGDDLVVRIPARTPRRE